MSKELEQGNTETPSEQPERLRGTVIWFDDSRGFGFLKVPGWKEDLFVHYGQIQCDGFKALDEGQLVEFELGKHHGKLQADKVVVIEE